jgi:hypothetical protein
MKNILTLALLLACLTTAAQNVSGLYTGTVYNDTTKITQSYEVALSEYKGKITGYAYTTFVLNDTFYYGIRRVRAFKRNNELVIEDQEMLAHNSPVPPNKGVRRLTVIPMNGQDSLTALNGKWYTTPTKRFISITGTTALKKDDDSSHSALIAHLTELGIIRGQDNTAIATVKVKTDGDKQKVKIETKPAPPKPVIIKPAVSAAQRTLKTLQTVMVASDTITIALYDNGVVDGDTVSLHIDGREILSRVRLTETFEKKEVVLSGSITDHEVILIAENLGTLPPNTGLLVIQDGRNRYPVYFSADMQTNARILIRKKQ